MSLANVVKLEVSRIRKKLPLLKPNVKQLSRQEAHNYWRQPDDGRNQPENFILGRNGRALERSQYLANLIASESPSSSSILEIGCNVGRNLNVLYSSGFHNLSAIEIRPEALELLRQTYPALAQAVNLYEGPVEEWIASFADAQFDVVFAMAVLQHIHYDSDFIFKDIARITKKRLIVMENEVHVANRNFPRNYKAVFEKLGMVQVFEDKKVPALPGICRVFSHSAH